MQNVIDIIVLVLAILEWIFAITLIAGTAAIAIVTAAWGAGLPAQAAASGLRSRSGLRTTAPASHSSAASVKVWSRLQQAWPSMAPIRSWSPPT